MRRSGPYATSVLPAPKSLEIILGHPRVVVAFGVVVVVANFLVLASKDACAPKEDSQLEKGAPPREIMEAMRRLLS